MTLRTLALAGAALLASLAGAQAEVADSANAPLTVYLQTASSGAAAPVTEGRQAAPVVSGKALSGADRYLIDRTAGEEH